MKHPVIETKARTVEAVLFDMDGTLVDSEPLWHRADASWLEGHGIVLQDDQWLQVVGLGGENFVRLLMEQHGLTGDYDQLLAEKNEVYRKLAAQHSRVFPEMLAAVRGVKALGAKAVIASASSLEIIETTMNSVGLHNVFDGYFSAEMVKRSKPHPDLYLHAAAELSLGPDSCLVVEDSQYGVLGALRAGMRVIAVPEAIHPETEEIFNQADMLTPMANFRARDMILWLTSQGLLT